MALGSTQPLTEMSTRCISLRFVIAVVCVTNEREESVVKQHNLFRKMLYSNMKLHVSAYNGHRQVSIPIKGSLYI